MFGVGFTNNFLVALPLAQGESSIRRRRRRRGQISVTQITIPFSLYAPLSRSFETPFRVMAQFKQLIEQKVLFHLTFKGIVELETRLVAKIDPTHVIEGVMLIVLNLLNKKKDV